MTVMREKMIKEMTVRRLSANTRRSYLNAVLGLARDYDIYDLDIIGNGEDPTLRTDTCYSKQISTKKSPASV